MSTHKKKIVRMTSAQRRAHTRKKSYSTKAGALYAAALTFERTRGEHALNVYLCSIGEQHWHQGHFDYPDQVYVEGFFVERAG